MRVTAIAALLSMGLLAGCGDTWEEQAIVGAGAGAGVALATDRDIAAGALIGAAGNVAFCNARPQDCR